MPSRWTGLPLAGAEGWVPGRFVITPVGARTWRLGTGSSRTQQGPGCGDERPAQPDEEHRCRGQAAGLGPVRARDARLGAVAAGALTTGESPRL